MVAEESLVPLLDAVDPVVGVAIGVAPALPSA